MTYFDDADYQNGLYQGQTDAQGRKNGFGELFYPNSRHIQYRGFWKDDVRHGLGTSFTQDGHIKAEGHWENNRNASNSRQINFEKEFLPLGTYYYSFCKRVI